jgi:hypothetical protein
MTFTAIVFPWLKMGLFSNNPNKQTCSGLCKLQPSSLFQENQSALCWAAQEALDKNIFSRKIRNHLGFLKKKIHPSLSDQKAMNSGDVSL